MKSGNLKVLEPSGPVQVCNGTALHFYLLIITIIIIIIIIIKADKILKYKDLTIEIERMWNVKTKVIPVVIGATGTISTSSRKYVSNIRGKYEVKVLQKTAILGTAHILRKVLTDATLKLII